MYVAVLQRRLTVRDEKTGAPAHETPHRVQDECLRVHIDCARWLVQYQDGGILQKGAGERDALPLAADRRMPRSPTDVWYPSEGER